jgi:GTP-binding protein
MRFIDEVEIVVSSGKGGDGAVSFRREKFIPRGGPDGGNGGDGGNVYFICKNDQHTLAKFRGKKRFSAGDGKNGSGSCCSGKSGQNLILSVPQGTIVSTEGEVIADFTAFGQEELLAKGGRGGLGNYNFRTSTNQAPKAAMPGEEGITLQLKLELKLIADVAIIGLPNAGKSTLISVISNARPKIANYPFTTLRPSLGVVTRGDRSIVIADIPGLIEGASAGKGLGIKFLKHIERSKILLHLIDCSLRPPFDAFDDYRTIREELANQNLENKREIVALTKIDAVDGIEDYRQLFETHLDKSVVCISAATGQGIDFLISLLFKGLGL